MKKLELTNKHVNLTR